MIQKRKSMNLKNRITVIRKVLFENYILETKRIEADWNEEATELALLLSITNDALKNTSTYFKYLEKKYSEDSYTNIRLIARKLSDAVQNNGT